MGLIILPIGMTSFLHSLHYPDPYTTNTVFCKIRIYVLQVTGMLFRWCLVPACFDRYALTSDSANLREFAKVSVAYRVIGVLIIIWLLFPLHTVIFFYANGVRCHALGNLTVAVYHGIYTILTGSILPVSIMITCAILIRRNIVRQYQRRCRLVQQSHNNNIQKYRKHIQQIFLMLLLQVVLYVITQTPWMILSIYSTATIYVTNKSFDRLVIEQFLAFLTEFTLYIYATFPFYLYTLASRAYREEFIKVLYYLFKRQWMKNTNRLFPVASYILQTQTRNQIVEITFETNE